jgi:hypothetical protein
VRVSLGVKVLDSPAQPLAVLTIEEGQIQSIAKAAAIHNVLERTLRNRLNGMAARGDCRPNSKKHTGLEEKAIIDYALDVDARGFQLNYNLSRDLANKLLPDRGAPHVGINWPANFIQRVPELQIRVNRKYDYQKALNEDSEIINA